MNYLGHYKVNGKIFYDKIEAILYANETLANIEWDFNDHILGKVNWSDEPLIDLKTLYKTRAQQIRDRFDYIVLFCSGGADSTNMVYSFLNNGIHVDEVVASAPLDGLSNYDSTSTDNNPENTINETKFAQLPLMQDLASRFPRVKFTLNNYFDTMTDYSTDDWLLKCSDWIHPTTVARFSLEKLPHLRNLADAGKRIGVIYGIDKPALYTDSNGDIFMNISDLAVNVPRPAFERYYPNVENVLFYYTPELPELMIKQAHLVARWMYLPENANVLRYLRNIDFDLPYERNRVRHSHWERSIIPCIYPDTVVPVFQAHKCIRIFFAEHDQWFYEKHYDTPVYQMIESDFRNFIKQIHPKYLHPLKISFELFRKYYRIGNVKDFVSKTSAIISL
jgi:hypothetical protein